MINFKKNVLYLFLLNTFLVFYFYFYLLSRFRFASNNLVNLSWFTVFLYILLYRYIFIKIKHLKNLFYKEVENTCDDCRYLIKKDLLSDCELVKRFNSKGVTKIIVTYVQLKSKGGRYGYIYVVIHKRFRKDEQFLYIDDMIILLTQMTNS